MKDHELRELVNRLTTIARTYHAHDSLRDHISRELYHFARDAGWLSPHDREGGEMCWPDPLEEN